MVPFGGFEDGLRDVPSLMQRGRWGAASFLRAERPGVSGDGVAARPALNDTAVSNRLN
jgi:hypothetical protein